jgi:ABC-type dipeptide/oligopeptide/nickel transport system ATPase component
VIAGALVLEPKIIIADEPVASLDASVRGEILALLLRLRDEFGLGALVVTHDLGLAWSIADRIAVMYLGRIVEQGPGRAGAHQALPPLHPHARLGATRLPDRRADRAGRRTARCDPHPRRLPVQPALPGAGIRRRRSGRCGRRLPPHRPADPQRRHRHRHGGRCHYVEAASPAGASGR